MDKVQEQRISAGIEGTPRGRALEKVARESVFVLAEHLDGEGYTTEARYVAAWIAERFGWKVSDGGTSDIQARDKRRIDRRIMDRAAKRDMQQGQGLTVDQVVERQDFKIRSWGFSPDAVNEVTGDYAAMIAVTPYPLEKKVWVAFQCGFDVACESLREAGRI